MGSATRQLLSAPRGRLAGLLASLALVACGGGASPEGDAAGVAQGAADPGSKPSRTAARQPRELPPIALPEIVTTALAPAPAVPIGTAVDTFEFIDAYYLPRYWEEVGGEVATVVVFTTLSCPIARRYMPTLGDMEREYRDRGVAFLALNVGPEDTLAGIAGEAALQGVDFPHGKDFTGAVVEALGATRTPEAVVLDGDGVIRYRGRIDDRIRFGGQLADARETSLLDALEALLDGREVERPETPVEGCAITLLRVEPTPELTWVDHIGPLVDRACVKCHRPQGDAPFRLDDYRSVSKRAAMVAEVVEQQRMPPWFADPRHGGVADAELLAPQERDAIVSWVRAGAPRGDGSFASVEATTESDWLIEPDLILAADRVATVPASGKLPYQYAWFDFTIDEDIFVDGVQVLPGTRGVLHHALLMADSPDVDVDDETTGDYVHIFVPGGNPLDLEPGTARRISGGTRLRIQLHYEPIGVAVTDRVQVGLRFPKGPVRKRLRTLDLRNHSFEIPAGAPAYAVSGRRTIPYAITLRGAMPHMHARGKDMALWVERESGQREDLLVVGNFNFDWQREYGWGRRGVKIRAGDSLQATGRFDNSAFNPYNPDPTSIVPFGQETEDEMMYCWLFYTRDDEILSVRVNGQTGERINPRPGGGNRARESG